MRSRSLPTLVVLCVSLPLAGCLDPGSSRPVLDSQGEVIARLEASYAQDLAALRSLAGTIVEAQRERLYASVEAGLVADVLDGLAEAPADAPAWLREYAALLREGAPAERRRAALATLDSVVEFESGADALLRAMDLRAASVGALFGEARANHEALSDAAGASLDLSLASREAAAVLWRAAVLERIEDADARLAAERLLERVLAPSR